MVYILTVYGWEGVTSTRVQVGCLDVAERVEAMMLARGYILRLDRSEAIERPLEEIERADRMTQMLAPLLFPK